MSINLQIKNVQYIWVMYSTVTHLFQANPTSFSRRKWLSSSVTLKSAMMEESVMFTLSLLTCYDRTIKYYWATWWIDFKFLVIPDSSSDRLYVAICINLMTITSHCYIRELIILRKVRMGMVNSSIEHTFSKVKLISCIICSSLYRLNLLASFLSNKCSSRSCALEWKLALSFARRKTNIKTCKNNYIGKKTLA